MKFVRSTAPRKLKYMYMYMLTITECCCLIWFQFSNDFTGSASATAQPVNTHSAQPTRNFTKQRPPSSQQQQPRQYQQPNNRRGDRDRDGDYNRGRPHPRGHPGEGRGGDGTRTGRQQPTSAASHHVPAESGTAHCGLNLSKENKKHFDVPLFYI